MVLTFWCVGLISEFLVPGKSSAEVKPPCKSLYASPVPSQLHWKLISPHARTTTGALCMFLAMFQGPCTVTAFISVPANST